MAQKLVVCHMGKCAAAAKAMRAQNCLAKCLVIALDCDDDSLAPPAAGIPRAEAMEIDIPVFCVARQHEAHLLAAASLRVCLLPPEEEEVGGHIAEGRGERETQGEGATRESQQDEREGGGGEGGGEGQKMAPKKRMDEEENILEDLSVTVAKGSKELMDKWELWIGKVTS